MIREMKGLVVLFSLFLLNAAERQDLSGKMFTFPVESNTHHVVLSPETNKIFFAVTVCLRAFSDISRAQSLFSLSLPSTDNGFLIYKQKQGAYSVYVLGQSAEFWGLQDESNVWNSVCATWDASTGLAQLWVNGIPSSRKGIKAGSSLTGAPKIILGQEQDSYGGKFDTVQSFVGMLTDVHMWDFVLSPHQITYYTYGGMIQPGNVLKWNSLEFSRNGYVVIENKETSRKAGNG
ncbi:serum amyloid P-component [Ictalurus furcatus]|uniref:serum amyloid P-component n=1 Tax=Ictalurus furcatus TaxID=66913 RepID=UPI0023509031|nr:serum amyloid P-component [Ictalurus furcatus]